MTSPESRRRYRALRVVGNPESGAVSAIVNRLTLRRPYPYGGRDGLGHNRFAAFGCGGVKLNRFVGGDVGGYLRLRAASRVRRSSLRQL